MGPNNLCHMSLIFSFCPHVTFYKTLMSLSTVFIKGQVGVLQLLKWPCRTWFLTHEEPYVGVRLFILRLLKDSLQVIDRNPMNISCGLRDIII